MIVSARSRFSAYRFDGGTADCLLGFVVPRMRRGVGRFLLPRAGSSRTVRVSFAWALAIAFSLLANAHIISPAWRLGRPRRRRASAVDTFRVPVLSSSSSHHLVRRGRFRSHRPRVSPRPSPVFSLLIGTAIVRRTAGVASHPSSVSFSYELGKTARNVISCSIALGCPRASRSSSRLTVSWGVSCRIVVVVVARGGCRFLRFCSLASRRGVASFVCPAAWRRACPHPSPVRLVCFSSFRLVGLLVARSLCPAGSGVLSCRARLI